MGYAYKYRETATGTVTTSSVSYTSNTGASLTRPVANVAFARFVLEDISYVLNQAGIANTYDSENFKITLTDDNVSFYVACYTSSSKYYPVLVQDGDPDSNTTMGGMPAAIGTGMVTSGTAKYNIYAYTTDNGNFYLEITDYNINRHYPLVCYCKVPHPTNPNKQVLVVSPHFPVSQGTAGGSSIAYTTKIKDIEDLTHSLMVSISSNTTVINTMIGNPNNIGVVFPDLSENTNIVMKKLVWFDLLEIPDFYQVPTTLDHWSNYDDGTYKYHVIAFLSADSSATIRIAIRYATVV